MYLGLIGECSGLLKSIKDTDLRCVKDAVFETLNKVKTPSYFDIVFVIKYNLTFQNHLLKKIYLWSIENFILKMIFKIYVLKEKMYHNCLHSKIHYFTSVQKFVMIRLFMTSHLGWDGTRSNPSETPHMCIL